MTNKRIKTKLTTEAIVRNIKHKMRREFTLEEKIRIIIEGLRGEKSIAAICRKEGITLIYTIHGAKAS